MIRRGKNDKKIAFIACVNNEMYFDECCRYIGRLYVPEGYETDIIGIREAGSMAEGYNAAMNDSDARYKVYLHQDVFIENRNFIPDMLDIFADPGSGLMGTIGTDVHSAGARYENEWIIGNVAYCNSAKVYQSALINEPERKIHEVCAVDGMLMAAQYDIEWDEDLGGWHFYDIAYCERFLNEGLKIAVPYQKAAWAFHDAGFCSKKGYEQKRREFCRCYPGYEYKPEDGVKYDAVSSGFENSKALAIGLFDEGRYIESAQHLMKAYELWLNDTELSYMTHFLSVWQDEGSLGSTHDSLADETAFFQSIGFLARRIENDFDTEDYVELPQAVSSGMVSVRLLTEVLNTYCFDPQKVLNRIASLMQK